MKKLHLAIATNKIEAAIADYTKRLEMPPCSFVSGHRFTALKRRCLPVTAFRGQYALWRTETLNISIRQDNSCKPGELRHLGWEDDSATEFSQDTDVNGIVWERFNAQHQADEINQIWQDANYVPNV